MIYGCVEQRDQVLTKPRHAAGGGQPMCVQGLTCVHRQPGNGLQRPGTQERWSQTHYRFSSLCLCMCVSLPSRPSLFLLLFPWITHSGLYYCLSLATKDNHKISIFSLESDTCTKMHFKSKKTAIRCVACDQLRKAEMWYLSFLLGTHTRDLPAPCSQGTIKPQTGRQFTSPW